MYVKVYTTCTCSTNYSFRLHSKDKRDYVYTQQELENGETLDPLWNAAQVLIDTAISRMHFCTIYVHVLIGGETNKICGG